MAIQKSRHRNCLLTVLLAISVVAGTVALSAPVAAEHGDLDTDSADAPVDTGSVHWQGQKLWMENLDPNKTYVLQRNGAIPSDVRRFRSDHDGEAILDTSNLPTPNQYVVYDPETDNYVTFDNGDAGANSEGTSNPDDADWTVRLQRLNVTATTTEVNNEGDKTTTTVTVDSNREGEYGVVITSSRLTDRELVEIFDLTRDDYDEDGIRIPTSQDREHSLDFSGIDGGNYTLDWTISDTKASDSVSFEVAEVKRADANFLDAVVAEERGDVVEFVVTLENATTADLTLSSDTVDYEAHVNVTDGNGDGKVTVRFNTYEPASVTSFWAAVDDDEVSITDSFSGESDVLDAADYDLVASIGGVEKDVATLELGERRTENVSTYTAPGDTFGRSETAAAFAESRATGELTQRQDIADRDVVLFEIKSSGIFGAFETTHGDSPEQRLIALTNEPDDPLGLTIVQRDSGAKRLDLGETHRNTDARALIVVPDPTNDTLYVAIKTDRAVFERPGNETGHTPKVGDTFTTNFTVNAAGPLVDGSEDETVSSNWTLVERHAKFDAEWTGEGSEQLVFVPATNNGTVTGATTVAPGTDMTVRARATGDGPFLKRVGTEVTPNGTFSATFDLSNASKGQNFTLTIPDQHFDNDAETAARVGTGPQAAVTIDNQTSDGSSVTVATVNTSEGGFVAIHDTTLLEGQFLESVRGTSSYLEPGTQSNVQVILDVPLEESQTVIALPYLDTNDNQQYDFVSSERAQDGPYVMGGETVTDDASVTIQSGISGTPTSTPTTAPTETATATVTATNTATKTGGQPGFGLVVSVLALVGASLLALRRD